MPRILVWWWCVVGLPAQSDAWSKALDDAAAVPEVPPAAALAAADRLRSAMAMAPEIPVAELQRALAVARRLREQHLERMVLERLHAAMPIQDPAGLQVAVDLGHLLVEFGELARSRELLSASLDVHAGANTVERWFAVACLARVQRLLGEIAVAEASGREALLQLEALAEPLDARLLQAKAIAAKTALAQGHAYGVSHLGECVQALQENGSAPVLQLMVRVDHLMAKASLQAPSDPTAERQLLADCEAALPASHLVLQTARINLAGMLLDREPAAVLALVQPVLSELERRGPGVPLWHQARLLAAASHRLLGDPGAAVALATAAAAATATQPPAALRRVEAELELAECQRALGDLAGALDLQQRLVAALGAAPHHPCASRVAQSLAASLGQLGDWEAAAVQAAQALAALPPWSTAVQRSTATANAAFARFQAGRTHGVRRELEAALAAMAAAVGAAAPATLQIAEQLAAVRLASGDAKGAVVAFTGIHRALAATHGLPAERALLHVAVAWAMAGDAASAAGLFAQVAAAREARVGAQDPALARVRANLALSWAALDRTEAARTLLRQALADLPGTFRLERALLEVELSGMLLASGEAAGAAELGHRALAALLEAGPQAPARWPLAWALAVRAVAAGSDGWLPKALAACAPAGRQWLAQIHLAPRELVLAAVQLQPLADVLAAAVLGTTPFAEDASRTGELALLVESLRDVPVRSARAAKALQGRPGQAEVTALGHDLRVAAARVAALGSDSAAAAEGLPARLRAAVEQRDRIQRQLAERAAACRSLDAAALTLSDLAAGLPARTAAVALRRLQPGRESLLLALVLTRDGRVRCVPLGPFAAFAAMSRELQQQGFHAPARTALAAKVLAPVVAALPADTTEVLMAVDGELQAVPWDALELDARGPLGARLLVRSIDSWFDLLAPERQDSLPLAPSLVAFGGISYGAAAEGAVARGGVGPFPPLAHAEAEVEALAAAWRAHLPEATLRTRHGVEASWAALAQLAPEAEVLHLATHGWFETERIDGETVRDPLRWSPARLEGLAPQSGLAPFTLCGLALAGANAGEPGLVRGEQLAALELSQCALAVLSSCHGGSGVGDGGHGVASLRRALRAAGARFVVAAPWPVDDAETKSLLTDFHRRLWTSPPAGRDPVRVLWAARMAARERGVVWRDWAGWTVVGL